MPTGIARDFSPSPLPPSARFEPSNASQILPRAKRTQRVTTRGQEAIVTALGKTRSELVRNASTKIDTKKDPRRIDESMHFFFHANVASSARRSSSEHGATLRARPPTNPDKGGVHETAPGVLVSGSTSRSAHAYAWPQTPTRMLNFFALIQLACSAIWLDKLCVVG